MKPFIVLATASLIALFAIKYFQGNYHFDKAARIGMSVMLLFTALGHVIYTEGMQLMIPDFIPYKKTVVYLTGVIEVMASIGLFFPRVRVFIAWLLILFFILILPANIKAALEEINYQKATFDGKGLSYLWFRIPFQVLLIAWVYFSSIKANTLNGVIPS